MVGEPVLSVTGLQKRVRGRLIVKDVSFEVGEGEIFGFLGPNGAGKTTTIRMLVGLIRPTAGIIRISGHNLQSNPQEALRQVGCIVENPDLYPYLTGYENLYQLAWMQGPHAVARIAEVAERVRLSDRLHDKVRTYSLGMRQRLGIAQALLGNPRLLILDEPTNGLDPAGIHELRAFLRTLAAQGLSIFISSHLLAEMELLCDRVAIIRDGRVIRTGDIRTLVAEASTDVIWRVEPLDVAWPILCRHATDGRLTRVEGGVRCTMSDEQVSAATLELAERGCKLFEVARQRASLEDVFLQTTGGGLA
ncbi:ABC transporter ATP-binding protein [Alicyclobacillus contaminans]|uniref:ABC transporter ATP-binding protein n=1 Tax=Alicyclobacillus contaminans TaxID=392016 RepID=UPI000400D60E